MTEKAIFYHVPKTGGTWVCKAMKNAGLNPQPVPVRHTHHPLRPMVFRTHATPSCISQRYKRGRFSFCFIRHPVDWYRSYWRDQQKALDAPVKWWMDELRTLPFREWVHAVLDHSPGFVTKLYRYYQPVDFVGRREALAAGLEHALHQAGERFNHRALVETPPLNVGVGSFAMLDGVTLYRILTEEAEAVEWTSAS